MVKLEEVTIEEGEVMVSYDVKSLFTSVPIDEAYAAIEKIVRADDGVKKRTGEEADEILKLLKQCRMMTNFRFRNKHYPLADGLPMGSPASPVIANIYMKVFEEKALATFPSTGPKVWFRFVYDIFSIVKKRHVTELLTSVSQRPASIDTPHRGDREKGEATILG